MLWKANVAAEVQVFAWLVGHERANTCDLLQKRRPYSYISPHCCIICKRDGESSNHIFLHCHLTLQLWIRLSYKAGL